jgi:hypothetical protein
MPYSRPAEEAGRIFELLDRFGMSHEAVEATCHIDDRAVTVSVSSTIPRYSMPPAPPYELYQVDVGQDVPLSRIWERYLLPVEQTYALVPKLLICHLLAELGETCMTEYHTRGESTLF